MIRTGFEIHRANVIAFKNQSYKTEEHYRVALNSFVGYWGNTSLIDLKFEDVRAWKLAMEKKGLSDNTIRGYLCNLRVVLAHLEKLGYPVISPDAIPVPKRRATLPVFITPEEVAQLIDAVGLTQKGYPLSNRLRNMAIISMLYGSGLRISELTQLNRNSIYKREFTVIGKGGKVRLCFIDERTENYLKAYLSLRSDNEEALFLSNQTGKRVRSDNIQKMMQTGWKKAGLTKPVHPHTLRHSFATDFLRNNGNMRYLQALLGHSSLDTTAMYAQVVDNDLREVYTKYHST